MRKRIVSFSIALILSIVTLASGASVAERCYNNTIVVQDTSGHGSGVLFTRDEVTFVWTAAHVADISMRPNGTFRDFIIKRDNKVAKARVIRCGDPYVAQDIALLQIIEGDLKGDAQFYKAFNEVKLGQEVIHCGSPFSIRLNGNLLSYGHISHVGRIFSLPFAPVPREVDQCSAITYPGCSGGPVFDAETGDILGIVSTVIVPTRAIYKWAKTHDCLWAFDSQIPLPVEIVPWRGDKLARLIKERSTIEIDKRWGKDEKIGSKTGSGRKRRDMPHKNGIEKNSGGQTCLRSESANRRKTGRFRIRGRSFISGLEILY
jgi:hypothetical protein